MGLGNLALTRILLLVLLLVKLLAAGEPMNELTSIKLLSQTYIFIDFTCKQSSLCSCVSSLRLVVYPDLVTVSNDIDLEMLNSSCTEESLPRMELQSLFPESSGSRNMAFKVNGHTHHFNVL